MQSSAILVTESERRPKRVLGFWGLELGVWGSLGIQVWGFTAWGFGEFRVYGFGGLGLGVWGLGLRLFKPQKCKVYSSASQYNLRGTTLEPWTGSVRDTAREGFC